MPSNGTRVEPVIGFTGMRKLTHLFPYRYSSSNADRWVVSPILHCVQGFPDRAPAAPSLALAGAARYRSWPRYAPWSLAP